MQPSSPARLGINRDHRRSRRLGLFGQHCGGVDGSRRADRQEHIALLDRLTRFGLIQRQTEHATVSQAQRDLAIQMRSPEQPVQYLSGGNQQKVVLARWLQTRPSVIILDEPTRGIDVGAKFEIYQLMRRLTDQGVAILMISSELPEILGMSDRIAVMHAGTIVATLPRSEASQELILALALGHTERRATA